MNPSDPNIVDPEAPTVDAATAEPGSVLVELMEHCLAQLEAGQDVNRDFLVADHPELESQIDACLASLQFIHRAVQPTEGMPSRLGDFRIVREIGRGGMGVVYEAEQISLKRQVALKVLRFGTVADSDAMKRFQREAETIASLHHTNIVPVFAVGVEKSVHYYAMQLIEGRSLREIASDQTADPIPPKTIARWGLQAAEALAHAHERGVVHRDIKPGNLILGSDDRIWLTDFGLAKRLDDVTLSLCGALLGTPRYMSPEQASALRHPVDHRTDIYSLGATLYELVTGRPPFDSDSPHVVISQILTTEPKPPRDFAPHVPRDLETIILKCLSKDASKRYQFARELADDLRAFEEGRAIKARRATLTERSGRWLKQNNRLLTTAVTAMTMTAALVIGGSAWWTMQQSARNGQLTLTTKKGPLTAEVLTATGEQAIPSFTVPNEQPVAIPEGEYQLRTMGRGSLSKTGLVTINRHPAQEIAVDIDRPELYPAIPLNSMFSYEFVDFGDGPDLIVLPEAGNNSSFELEEEPRRTKKTMLSRLSGATGKEIWSLDIAPQSAAIQELLSTDELRSQWWSSTVFGWKGTNETPVRVLRPLPDLDDDGVPDLIWRLGQGYGLFAVSGKTGKPLLWHSTPMSASTNTADAPPVLGAPYRRQFGDAALATIPRQDGKTIPILIVIELGITTQEGTIATSRVFALNVRDKSEMWSTDLPGVSAKLALATFGQSTSAHVDLAVITTDTEVLTFDVATGKPVGTPHRLLVGDDPNGTRETTPRIVDVDADDQPEVLLTQGGQNSRPLGLQLVSLSLKGPDTSRTNWSFVFPASEQIEYFVEHRDLNDDGVEEILLMSQRQEFDCRVLDGHSGHEIWRRRRPSNVFVGRHSPVVVGDDMDGDGWRELFVASIDCDNVNDPGAGMLDKGHSLFVDCFSGQNGRSLWWNKNSVTGKSSPFLHPFTIAPRWWAHGLSGERSLLITTFLEPKFPNSQGYVYAVDARTGRFEEMASQLVGPLPIDLNRDGHDELVAFKMGSDSFSHEVNSVPGELRVFRGENPTGWRHFGNWQPLMDLDGDGLSELWQPNHRVGGKLPIISGRDGTEFADWGSNQRINDFIPLTEPTFDLDHDGLTEVLAVHDAWYEYLPGGSSLPGSHALGLDLVSPKTRRRHWAAPHVPVPQWADTRQIQLRVSRPLWKDLDGDGDLEIVVPYLWHAVSSQPILSNARAQYCLAVLEARTGRMTWNAVLKEEPANQNSSWSSSSDWLQSMQFGDMDGDGEQDLLVSFSAIPDYIALRRESVVQAVSGRDGHLLWPEFQAHLYQQPEGLNKQQQEALEKNTKLQQFIHGKHGLMQAVLANLDGKPGVEVVRLDFIPEPKSDRPFLDGQLILSVLNGQTGKVQSENRWSGIIHPHDDFLPQKLMTLRRPGRDAIVIAKAKYDPQFPLQTEDWLLAVPAQETFDAGNVRELPVLEVRKARPADQVWKLNLNDDDTDELVSWRPREQNDGGAELVTSQGLNEMLWKRPAPSLAGYNPIKVTLLENGKVLFVSTPMAALVVSSDGELLSNVVAPQNSYAVIVPGSDGWIGRWATGQMPRAIVSDGSQTRSDVILPVDDQGRFQQPSTPAAVVISHLPDLRSHRRLPWTHNRMDQVIATEAFGLAVGIWLLVIAPFYLIRWGWSERRLRWPLIGLFVGIAIESYAVWCVTRVAMTHIRNPSPDRIVYEMLLAQLVVGLLVASSLPVLVRAFLKGELTTWLWLSLAIVVSTADVAVMRWLHDFPMHANETYRIDGWYQILLPGPCYGVCLFQLMRWLVINIRFIAASRSKQLRPH